MVKESKSEYVKKQEFPEWMQNVLAFFGENPEVAGLAASIGAIALGAALAIDDYKDLGKLGDERDPPVPHHWEYGILILLAGVAGTCASGLALLKKLPKKKVEEGLPPSVLEGAPREVIEQFK